MKLSHKNFFYTAVVTAILTILVLGYFIFMLPSLYVDYMSEVNYDAIVSQHKSYLKDGSYENVTVKNPSCMTIEIPLSQDTITVTGKYFQVKVTPSTQKMKDLLTEVKSYIRTGITAFQDNDQKDELKQWKTDLSKNAEKWKSELLDQTELLEKIPFTVKTETKGSYDEIYQEESTRIHVLSKDTIIVEAGVSDGENHYTNFLGITYSKDRLVVSNYPAMTPQINEITPIVLRSLPMLAAVLVLFALVVSYLYSRGIVEPILGLVRHTQTIRQSGDIHTAAMAVKGRDEIAMLTATLNELYEKLDQNYLKLETANRELEEKNKSQEVFLRSSSHQLKTPIAAALLLVDGMVNQIGKYQDTTAYLPEVKKQLLSMRKIVEDLLYLSRREEHLVIEDVDLGDLAKGMLEAHRIEIQEGEYELEEDYSEERLVQTDGSLLLKILDNLITNALVHGTKGARITIIIRKNLLSVCNSDARIAEDMMPHVFEPFVTSSGSGHGLGLYISAYYARLCRAELKIRNTEQGVLASLQFDPSVSS